MTSGPRTPSDIPSEVVELFGKFLGALTQQMVATMKSELIDESLAEVALARALHVTGSCPELYPTLFPFMLGKGFAEGSGAYQPLAVCELATQLEGPKRNGIPCDDAVAAAKTAVANVG